MSLKQDELKAQMMAEAEAVIEKMLEEAEVKGRLQLSDIERMVRGAGEQVMAEWIQEIVKQAGRKEAAPKCETCSKKMKYKGQKTRDVLTETGEIELERAYYYCKHCRIGVFPPR